MNLTVRDLVKNYDGIPVLNHVNLTFQSGNIYCLMSPSGSGKTTFFRILMGLESADNGVIEGIEGHTVTAVFQENRLCETFSAINNISMVLHKNSGFDRSSICAELGRLLPEDSINKPVCELSGGMKRRVAVCRALMAQSDLVLMDEPFTGMDEKTKFTVIQYVKEKSKNRLVIVSTHQEEDVLLLGGELVEFD